MRRTILAAAVLAFVAMATPHPAAAQVSIDIEKPGLSLHAGPPVYGPPVVVGPPAVVYPPPVYYAGPPHHWKHWDKHYWHHEHEHHWHHGHHGDWD